MNKLTLSALALITTMGLAACSSESDDGVDFERAGENAGEMMDDAADSTRETWDDATGRNQSTWDEMNGNAEDSRTRDGMGGTADDTGDPMEDGYDDRTQ